MDFLVTNWIIVGKDNTVNGIGNSTVDKIKVNTKTAKLQSQDKSKVKIW